MLLGTREFTTLPSSLQSLYEINMITYTAPSTGFTYPLTVLFLVPVILCVVMALVMKFTMLGRGLYAIGGDANAAVSRVSMCAACSSSLIFSAAW